MLFQKSISTALDISRFYSRQYFLFHKNWWKIAPDIWKIGELNNEKKVTSKIVHFKNWTLLVGAPYPKKEYTTKINNDQHSNGLFQKNQETGILRWPVSFVRTPALILVYVNGVGALSQNGYTHLTCKCVPVHSIFSHFRSTFFLEGWKSTKSLIKYSLVKTTWTTPFGIEKACVH